MTTEISNQDKLKIIVTAALNGGWRNIGTYTVNKSLSITLKEVTGTDIRYSIEYKNYVDGIRSGTWFHNERYPYTFLGLLSDSSAMEAIWGDGKVCNRCGETLMTQEDKDIAYNHDAGKFHCLYCSCSEWTPCHYYHALEAFRIIYSGGDGVGYLYEQMVKLKGEE